MFARHKVRDLGGDWIEVVDPRSGITYFANTATGESRWDEPEEGAIEEDSLRRRNQSEPAGLDRASDEDSSDEENGRPKAMKAHSLEVLARTSTMISPPVEKDVWLERQDMETGSIAHVNPSRPRRNSKRSIVVSKNLKAKGTYAFSPTAWVERVDPRTGRIFYYNPITSMTSWEQPKFEIPKFEPVSVEREPEHMEKPRKITVSDLEEDEVAHYDFEDPIAPINKADSKATVSFLENGEVADENEVVDLGNFLQEVRVKNLRAAANENLIKLDLDNLTHKASISIDNVDESAKNFVYYAEKHFDKSKPKRKTKRKFSLVVKSAGSRSGSSGVNSRGKNRRTPRLKPNDSSMQSLVDPDLSYTWQGKMIKRSLHTPPFRSNSRAFDHDAKLAFKQILNYCGDTTSRTTFYKPNPIKYCKLVLGLGIGNISAGIKDEVYAQLIKQSIDNPNESSRIHVWELLTLVSGTFDPSIELSRYLMNHYRAAFENGKNSETLVRYAKYAMLRLQKTMKLAETPRLEVPCEEEINAVLKYQPITIEILLINGGLLKVQIDSWTTVSDLKEVITYKLDIGDERCFDLFEIDDKGFERALVASDRVLDILAFWKRNKLKDKVYLLYKIRLFFSIPAQDVEAVKLEYYQAVNDVNTSRYPCTRDDYVTLAAYDLRERLAESESSSLSSTRTDEKIIIPRIYANSSPEFLEQLKSDIMDEYDLFEGLTAEESRGAYLYHVKEWKYYGSTNFIVQNLSPGSIFPERLIVSVNKDGIILSSSSGGGIDRILQDIPYSKMTSWGYSTTDFHLEVTGGNELLLRTREAQELNNLVHAYNK